MSPEDVAAPEPIEDVPCLYLARGVGQFMGGPGGHYALNPLGPVQSDTPTLVVAWDTVLEIGDRLENIRDPLTGRVFQARSQVGMSC